MKKIQIKSVKGKIVAGVVAASVLSTSAFAFADTNAGKQFTAWGQLQIDAAKAAVQSAIDGSRTTAQTKVENDAKAGRDAAEGQINSAGAGEKADTKTKIEGKLAEHVASLTAALQTFMDNIGADFDAVVAEENTETTTNLNNQYNTLEANITSVLTAAKNTNVNDVTEQSLLVKGKATSDLIKKINEVKSALQAEIDRQKKDADSEVSDHLASEVARINNAITGLISGLETEAKTAIAAAGQKVEDSAIANFERVINRIGVETPVVVDPQRLDWVVTKKFGGAFDGKIKFKVTNTNEFDVVFRYQFRDLKGAQGGVTETPFAESSVKPGVEELEFNNIPVPVLGAGTLYIEYMDENGDFQYAAELGLW
ncbi:hypothetical protein SM124_16550 [Bacillus sp. 31A1R]|uniref:Uncharacterized protein n=1 Tax=Robertmurraya mangrovi TaxID=3098077 RepID=A0ABU5J1P2_9BACI|nr:hypothetical protein [Bacillus sp. 31A1R]MDZ5473330.1 hypothetical protein [Bacillus sp. 31A1R]